MIIAASAAIAFSVRSLILINNHVNNAGTMQA